ncbi:DUF559 domain-containing protein, partial [Mycobacterium alsense]|uniref:DUF559 domain-containing protein n=1 Tax=Mycobacterium alsense TaxID=324058 RepID=UPI000E765A01
CHGDILPARPPRASHLSCHLFVQQTRELWRVDFAWPAARLAVEYESIDWHAGRDEMIRDKRRLSRIQELGWTIIPIVVDDVRREPDSLANRILNHLLRPRMAG